MPFLFSSAAFAQSNCPNLSGNYPSCQIVYADNPEWVINISQASVAQPASHAYEVGITVDGEQQSMLLNADGKEYVEKEIDPQTGEEVVYKHTTTCEGQTLIQRIVQSYAPGSDEMIHSSVSFTREGSALLVQISVFDTVVQTTHCQ